MTVIDTNVVLHLLRGELREPLPTRDVAISVITEIELRGYPASSSEEETTIRALIATLRVVPLDDEVKRETIRLRRTTRLRMPDALVLASAIVLGAELLTNDQALVAAATIRCRSVATR